VICEVIVKYLQNLISYTYVQTFCIFMVLIVTCRGCFMHDIRYTVSWVGCRAGLETLDNGN